MVTSCIKAVRVRSKSDHIISMIIITVTNDNKVALIREESNLLINNCIVINRDIKWIIIDFVGVFLFFEISKLENLAIKLVEIVLEKHKFPNFFSKKGEILF